MHGAILSLFSLDSTLQRVRAKLTSLSARQEQSARERRSIRARLVISKLDLRTSRRQLALLVHTLYEHQSDDPLAVVLGAESLEEAINTLDDLRRAAQQNRQIAARSREAQTSLLALTRRLARESARIRILEATASRTEATLEATNTATLPATAAAPGGRTITVVATGYSVIPLGTSMTIPGYGHGVAADTGSAVQGAAVDLWFPTVRQALDWGRRVVTVALH